MRIEYRRFYIREENKNSFIAVVKDFLVNSYGLRTDKHGDLSTAELAITREEIGIATLINDEEEVRVYFVDGRTRVPKIKVLFSVDMLADEMIGAGL